MSQDWLFKNENSICSFRTTGVLVRDNKILLQREKCGNEYALPGGHVMKDETSQQSLVREYKEETDADIVCERLIWVEESFWKWDNRNASTISFYYLIKLVNEEDIPDGYFESQKDNCNIILEWIPIQKLKELIVYPRFLADKINNISDSIEHFISNE